jgi:hypothetical protein
MLLVHGTAKIVPTERCFDGRRQQEQLGDSKIIARLILKGENISLMTEALDRISTYCHLREPNRSREEVERQLSFFPFNLSEEVYEYYQWSGAPTGDRQPEGWDGPHNDNSTYTRRLEQFLGSAVT